jgi:hypothetical protein
MVKVEKGKEDGDKESKKNWKGCDVKALIALLGEMELEVVKKCPKKVRFQSFQRLLAHIVQLDFLGKKFKFKFGTFGSKRTFSYSN